MYYLLNRSDGGVSVMQLMPGSDLAREIQVWEENSGMRCVSSHQADKEMLKTDKESRNQWRIVGGMLSKPVKSEKTGRPDGVTAPPGPSAR